MLSQVQMNIILLTMLLSTHPNNRDKCSAKSRWISYYWRCFYHHALTIGPNAQPSQTDSLNWIYCSWDVVSCWLSVGHGDNEMEIGKASFEVQEKAEYIPQFSINHLTLQTIILDLCRRWAARHCSAFLNSIDARSRLLHSMLVNSIIKTVFCMQSSSSTYISLFSLHTRHV